MSATVYNQAGKPWGGLRVNTDVDTRSKSFAVDLDQVSDTIASVLAVNVTRLDGAAMTAGDLAILGAPIVNATTVMSPSRARYPPGTLVTLWLAAGTVGGTYNVEIVVATAGTRTIGRDTLITVSGSVG